MAIPGFTAEAALYPTSNLYRTLALGVAGAAHEVTAQQGRMGDSDCTSECYDVWNWNRCMQACGTMADAGSLGDWENYCRCVCNNQLKMCLQGCGYTIDFLEHCSI
jgi:hypothetical protein